MPAGDNTLQVYYNPVSYRQSAAKINGCIHLIGRITGKIVLKEQAKIYQLIQWALDRTLSVIIPVLTGFQKRQCCPGFGILNEFAVQFEFNSRSIPFCSILWKVLNIHIINDVGNEVIQLFIV